MGLSGIHVVPFGVVAAQIPEGGQGTDDRKNCGIRPAHFNVLQKS
jgi:hypothetical protein